jgi:competence protein ComEC
VPILLVAVLVYTLLVGASASVVRAAIMGALTLIASYLGRQTLALNSLFVAAIVMTLLDPFTLGDVGFQLSFAATLGLVIYTRPIQNAVERGLMQLFSGETAKKIVGVLGDAVLVTLAAQITTLPILIVTFRQVSLLTLLVNALVLPAQTGVMVFGGAALLAGMLALPLGQIVAWAAWLFLAWTIQVIHLFALVPGVSTELGYVDPLWGVAYYAVLAALTFWFSRTPEQRMDIKTRLSKVSPRIALPALGITLLLSALALSWQPDGRLHVHALNVEGGSVFVQTPAGRQILIGGSNSPSALLAALGSRMPFWDRDIDLVVVPRTDAESLNGLLAVVDRYRVGQIVSVEVGDNRASREWRDMITAKQIEVIEPGLGIGIEEDIALTLDAGGWVRIEVGATSVGIGTPPMGAHADVIVLDEVTDQTATWLKSDPPSIVVTQAPVGLDRLVEGIAFVSAEARSIELSFDGTQWSVHAAP